MLTTSAILSGASVYFNHFKQDVNAKNLNLIKFDSLVAGPAATR